MRRTRLSVVGIVLLSAAAIGESLAFIGGLFGESNLTWIGYAIVIAPVLVVLVRLLRTPKNVTNTIESFDRTIVSDADGPEFSHHEDGQTRCRNG